MMFIVKNNPLIRLFCAKFNKFNLQLMSSRNYVMATFEPALFLQNKEIISAFPHLKFRIFLRVGGGKWLSINDIAFGCFCGFKYF